MKTIKHAKELEEALNELQGQVVDSIKSFFRHSKSGDFMFNESFASNEAENVEIEGISINEDQIYLFGTDQFGVDKTTPIEECSIENLLGALSALERKAYNEG
jgi:tRNA(Leu) C34 or U34 (ribose-2'-O)-methylase TrmL